jgi:hypothetical protein
MLAPCSIAGSRIQFDDCAPTMAFLQLKFLSQIDSLGTTIKAAKFSGLRIAASMEKSGVIDDARANE